MKKTRLFVCAILALILAMPCFAGGQKSSGGSTGTGPLAGKRIAVAQSTLYDEWNNGVHDMFEKIGREFGAAEVNIQDGNSNSETQQRQLEDFITQKYDVIFIAPVAESQGINATLDKAKAAGIPVIAFDTTTSWPGLVSHIAWDHAETGRLSGRYVADYAKNNLGGKLRVGVLQMLDVPATAVRSQTFKEEIEKGLGKANITYVFEQDAAREREMADRTVTNNIAKPLDVIWAAVDNGAFGARVALQTNGVQGTKIVSSGAWGSESFQTIANKDRYYMMFIGVPPEGIVRMAYETAVKYFAGDKNIPKEQNIELVVIDSSNIDKYRDFF